MKPAPALARQPASRCRLAPLDLAERLPGCGGKAANLARLLRLGIRVPPGFVILDRAFQGFLEANDLHEVIEEWCADLDPRHPVRFQNAAQAIRERINAATIPTDLQEEIRAAWYDMLGGRTVVVRSSALGEDSEHASFAGQLDSVLQVTTATGLQAALLQCWASYWSERALFYQRTHGWKLTGLGVIVQEQVAARYSGVLFTRDPEEGAAAGSLVVEYAPGLGDALVAGRVTPGRVRIERTTLAIQHLSQSEEYRGALPADDCWQDLARVALEIEQAFGAPQDIEWSVDAGGRLFLLQARPITTLKSGSREVVWSNANVNENFPEPICPLLYSFAIKGYYHYFRNLGLALGMRRHRVERMEPALRQLIGVHAGRMYYNLSNVHAVLGQAPFGDALVDFFNRFVGTQGDAASGSRTPAVGRLKQSLEVAWMGVRALWQLAWLPRRMARFERTVDTFAAATHPESLTERDPAALLMALRGFLQIRYFRWTNASLADAAAMLSYGLLDRLLRVPETPGNSRAMHNGLLKGLKDVVSSVPIVKLWELSRLVRRSPVLRDWFYTLPAAELLDTLRRRPEASTFQQAFETFLENWGYRCSGELMLTVPSYQDEPARLLEIIRSYADQEGPGPLELLEQQARARQTWTAEVLESLRGQSLLPYCPWPGRAALVRLVLRWAQQAIALRERARCKQALLYSRCRFIVLALGQSLVRAGWLDRADDAFFLTIEELDDLCSGSAMFPSLARQSVRLRQQEHTAFRQQRPDDTLRLNAGSYWRPDVEWPPPSGDTQADSNPMDDGPLRGTSASGGVASGPAAVLGDLSEFARLQAGDVLVTRQTDPGWAPAFFLIRGLILERGGMLSHGAILAREYGIPTLVGVAGATRRIRHGQNVRVDGDRGLVELP